MASFTESVVEEAALAWLVSLGYTALRGPKIAVNQPKAERGDPNYRDVVLEGRLCQALARLNPELPVEARDDALAVPHDEALHIRDDVGFFQAVRARPAKRLTTQSARSSRGPLSPTRWSISLRRPGLKKPDLSILSDEFLAEIRGMPQRNLAVELLQKLLKGEIKARARRNVVQARSFAGLLEQVVRRYQNRAIEVAQVIEELIGLAKDMRTANARGEALKLTDDELAFYDALEANDSAVKVLGEPTLANTPASW